ncbi:hypothetical protein PT273_01145 [Orbaceae bacterium ESL0727]|nr:hypothetical protein [Orbaceae bacterium ESL0727]
MKTNRKYRALLFLIIMMPLFFFLGAIIVKLIITCIIYAIYRDFIFSVTDFYIAFKFAPFGFIAAFGLWYIECRRLGIKILSK